VSSAAERVTAALSDHGRSVPLSTVERQLGGLGGLTPEQAADALLATYGLAPDGSPTWRFVPTRGGREVIRSVMRSARGTLVYVLIAGFVGLVPALTVPLLMRLFVDEYLVGGDQQWAWIVIAGLVASAAVMAVVVILQYTVLRRLVLRMARVGQIAFAWRALTMDIASLQAFGPGNLVARKAAMMRFSFQAGMLLPLAWVNAITAVAYFLALLWVDWVLALAAVGILLLGILSTLVILRKRSVAQQLSDSDRVALTGYTSDVIASAESVKAAAWEQFAFGRWAALRRDAAESLTRLGVANQHAKLVPILGQVLGLGLFLALGIAQVFAGQVTLGTLVASQAYVVALLTAADMLVLAGVLYQSVTSAAQQFDPVQAERLDPEMLTVGDSSTSSLRGDVELRDVTFGYDVDGPPLLAGLSLDVPAGRRIALVGRSGSGKTTLARLIIGELRPWSGSVELDGQARLTVPREVRTRDIAYVPQTAVLFPGTIRDNLTLWDDSIPLDNLQRAARDACIEDTILGRPGAFYHEITSADGGFSGGELQRLSIARALAGDPRLLVLDEATSALDPVVEADVESHIRRRGITTIVVAHRLSTIRDADEILVIDEGRVVQRGRFDDLSREGLFAELVRG